MKIKYIISTTLVILYTLTFAQSDKTNLDNFVNGIKDELPKLMEQQNVPGLAISITDKNQTIWQSAYGYTDRENKIPVTTKTNFSIQSATKAFTSAAILMAVQEGKIDLNAPITTYLKKFSVNSAWNKHPEQDITIWKLLTHTSGLGHETSAGNNYDISDATFEEHVESISDTWLKFPVGQRQSYSNLGISLLGDALQQSTGLSFIECMNTMVLNPLKMGHSTFSKDQFLADKNHAVGHSNSFKNIPSVPGGGLAAGGLYSNVEDLSKFARFILNKGSVNGKKLLNDSLFKLMTTLPFKAEGQRQGYGAGLETKYFGPMKIVMMPGRGFGYIGGIVYFPDSEIALSILTNNEDNNLPMMIIFSLAQQLAQAGIAESNFTEIIPNNLPDAKNDLINEFSGEYLGAFGSSLKLTIKESAPLLSINGTKTEMKALEFQGKLYVRTQEYLLQFIYEPGHNMKYVKDVYDSEVFFDFNAKQNEEAGKLKKYHKKYLGEYHIKKWGEVNENIKIHQLNGHLYLNNKRLTEIEKGIFRDCTGVVTSFKGSVPTYNNIKLHKNE